MRETQSAGRRRRRGMPGGAGARAQAHDRDQRAVPDARLFQGPARGDRRRVHEGQSEHQGQLPAALQEYEDAASDPARGGHQQLPDVASQGINRQRILVDRGIAQPIDR